jgi:hypothetical protein
MERLQVSSKKANVTDRERADRTSWLARKMVHVHPGQDDP